MGPTLNARQTRLLDTLRHTPQELSGQDLHARLKAEAAPMGLATVYRHLRQLQQWGLVRCRHLPSGEALFAPTERDDHHLTCVDCGHTHRLQCCPVHGLEPPRSELAGFLPLFHTLEFFGLCEACQQRQSQQGSEGVGRAPERVGRAPERAGQGPT